MPIRPLPLAFLLLALLASTPLSLAQESTPQRDWMVHMSRDDAGWRYVPDRIVLLPGGLVQLMVFGEGQFSLTLDDLPDRDADIATTTGTVRTAELRAPDEPGEYPFHDRYHPEARGILVVRAAAPMAPAETNATTAQGAVIGVVPSGYESRFAPDRLVVDPGEEIVFRANGTFAHELHATGGAFAAGELRPGEESRFRAPTEPGEYAFECRYHAAQGMRGVLVVRTPEAQESAAPPEEERRTPVSAILVFGALAIALALVRRPRRER